MQNRPGVLGSPSSCRPALRAGWTAFRALIASSVMGFGLLAPGQGPVLRAAVLATEIIALEGQPAPGGATGETFGSLLRANPRVNSAGDVAFIAPVLGARPDAEPISALYLKTARGLQRLAQTDAVAPGLDAPPFATLSHLALNDSGAVAFISRRGATEALFSNASGAWRVVADTLGPQPSGLRFQSFSTVATDYKFPLLLRSTETPEVLFPAEALTNLPDNTGPGLWTADADGWDPRALFVPGTPAPALTDTPLLLELTHWGLGGEPERRSVFLGFLSATGNPPVRTNLQVLWTRHRRGPLEVVARAGDRAPVPTPHVFYSEFSHASVNGAGNVAFAAALVPETSGYSRALFAGPPDALQPILREGETVRRPDGTVIGPLASPDKPTLNAAGQVLFHAGILDRAALLRWSPGTGPEAVAVFGDSWPGAPSGWTIGRFINWNFNAAGRVAFAADLFIPDHPTQSWGLWITDATGSPTLIAIQSLDPALVTAPPDIPVLAEGLPLGPTEGFSGGSDGLPRFLSDRNGAAYAGQRPDGLSGIFLGSVDPGTSPPPDETFRLVRTNPTAWAPLDASAPSEFTLANPALLFPEDGVQARLDKVWTGTRLRLEIAENLDGDNDLLGLDRRSVERQGIALERATSGITHLGQPIGTLSRPSPGTLEVAFGPLATTEAIRALVRSLAYGSSRGVAAALRNDARYTHPRRLLRLRIADAGGRSTEGIQFLFTPSTTGLAFEGHSLDHRIWADGNRPYSDITVRLQLLLTDGTRLTIGCAPTAADVKWTPNVAAVNFTIESSGGAPCAAASMRFNLTGGFPSVVRLHSWEALHIVRREEGLTDTFTHGLNFCAITFFRLWIASQFDGAAPALHTLPRLASGASPAPAAPLNLSAAPYSLRTWMERSDEGRRLIGLYQQHTGEVVTRLLSDLGLLTDALTMVREFLPGLREFLAGNGARVVIRPDMVAMVNRVWDRLAADGSPALRQAIETERARFHGLEDFAGRTFAEWGRQLGMGSPEAPFITASSPRLEGTTFHVEANRVSGLTYTLWRRDAATGGVWQAVTQGTVRSSDTTVELTDTNAPRTPLLYRVRAD